METDSINNCVHFPPEAIFPQATFPEVNRFASVHLSLSVVTDSKTTLCHNRLCRAPQVSRGLQ